METNFVFKAALLFATVWACLAAEPQQNPVCAYNGFVNFPKLFTEKSVLTYQSIESGLTIYLDWRLPCDGVVSYYTFLSSDTLVRGLHIAIIRPSGGNTYRIVAETYIGNWLTGKNANEYVTWDLKDQEVAFRAGDYIGVFYDQMAVTNGFASVRSSGLPTSARNRYNARTVLTDAETLAKDDYIFGRMDGIPTTRLPALFATVRYTATLLQTTTFRTFIGSGGMRALPSAVDSAVRSISIIDTATSLPTQAPNYSNAKSISCTFTLTTSVSDCSAVSTLRFVYDASNRTCTGLITCGQQATTQANLIASNSTAAAKAGNILCQLSCSPSVSRKRREAFYHSLSNQGLANMDKN